MQRFLTAANVSSSKKIAAASGKAWTMYSISSRTLATLRSRQLVAHHRLGVDAEGAVEGAAPAGRDRDHRVEGVRVEVVLDLQEPPVDLADERDRVEVGDQRPARRADRSGGAAVADPRHRGEVPLRVEGRGEFEQRGVVFADGDRVDGRAQAQRLLRQRGDVGPDEDDEGVGQCLLEPAADLDVVVDARRAGLDDDQAGGEATDPRQEGLEIQPRGGGVDQVDGVPLLLGQPGGEGEPQRE